MIITIISLVLLIACLVATIWIAISLQHNPPLAVAAATWLTKSELGQVEERLFGLREVIIIADKIDIPTKDNARDILFALIDNFSESVVYNFLVPESYAELNGQVILQRYYAVIELARELSGNDLPNTLIRLHSRPVEQEQKDYPYIFYRFIDEDSRNQIVAFRGEPAGVGIANDYRRLEPEIARSFLFSVLCYLATAKQPIEMEDYKEAEFSPEERTIKFAGINKGIRENEKARSIPQGGA